MLLSLRVAPPVPFSVTWSATPRCSMTRSPTFGDSTTGSMPCLRSSSGWPTPERSSSSGVSTAPAQMITSRRAPTTVTLPLASTVLTPVTRVPSKVSETARDLVATVRPPAPRCAAWRANTGRTNAS
jgi:hypothetical protein